MTTAILNIFAAGTILSGIIRGIVPAQEYVWNWRDAVVMKAMSDIYDDEPSLRPEIAEWAQAAMAASLQSAHGRHPNGVASGVGPAFLMRIGLDKEECYAASAEKIYRQYQHITRFNGATSHRQSRIELWDDTVYMLSIFLIEMYHATGNERYLDDCVREVVSHAAQLRDRNTGMWWHGWAESSEYHDDGCCEYLWNSNNLQRNSEFWGRGNGWIAMSLADLLSVMPHEHSQYKLLRKWFSQMADTLCRYQDSNTGHWMQLPLRIGEDGNFIESSCTAMFGYAMARGLDSGLLKGRKYVRSVELAWDGLQNHSVSIGIDDSITMGNICAGTCIGGRDYYYSRPVSENESFALGAFLLFANRMKHRKF